jgi:hypothetical protein
MIERINASHAANALAVLAQPEMLLSGTVLTPANLSLVLVVRLHFH